MKRTTLTDLYPRPEAIPVMAVAAAQEAEVLAACAQAVEKHLVVPVLVGDEAAIREISERDGINLAGMEIVDIPDEHQAVETAVKLVSAGRAGLLMKGLVDTSVLLKAVLNGEWGLRTGRILSHVALFDVPGHDRILAVTDAAMNIAPDLDQKEQILRNAVDFMHSIGYPEPNVAVLAAKEKVSEKMPATVDAAALAQRNRDGTITGCRVAGPLALDNAVSVTSAQIKGITDPVAGYADILLAPDIEAGNILYKALAFLTESQSAGVIVGARSPIVLTSRADSGQTKLHSIAIAARAAGTAPPTERARFV